MLIIRYVFLRVWNIYTFNFIFFNLNLRESIYTTNKYKIAEMGQQNNEY